MADINRLMQIINALEANGTDVEGVLGSLLTPVPMPQPMQRDDGMQPVPMPSPMKRDTGMEPVPMGRPLTQEEMLKLIERRRMGLPDNFNGMDASGMRQPNLAPFTGPGPGAVTDMERTRRMMEGRNNRSGILDLLQRMR